MFNLPNTPTVQPEPSNNLKRLLSEKKAATDFVNRRHAEWSENYELYRNKVKTNRLTQRQEVNIPLMKETIKTLLSKIDEPPTIDWKELSGDIDRQMILQERWNADFDRLNLRNLDIQDKKTTLLYGRSFKKLNWFDGDFDVRALDIYDVLVDPLTDPLDLETARFVIHQNIFRSLREILADERYTKEAKRKLQTFLTMKQGLIITGKNKKEWEEKMERMKIIGLDINKMKAFAGGEVIVNITEHYSREWDEKSNKWIRKVFTYADDIIELRESTMNELLGVDFYPFVSWAEDVETQDFWSDGTADLVRTPNKVLNIWFSQLVENRTLRNFQMHWYDATISGYSPQTYDAGPGRMLPSPGDPNKTIRPVDISGLDESLTAINYLMGIVEKGTATIPDAQAYKSIGKKGKQTLGEVKAHIQQAMERILIMTKFYNRAWEELAMKYYQILKANDSGKRTLYKSGKNGILFPKIVYPSDWKSKAGYKAIVRSSSEQETEKQKSMEQFLALKQEFPNNKALNKIIQRRMLETVDLSREEIKEVEDEEEQTIKAAQDQQKAQLSQGQSGQPSQSPQNPQLSPIQPNALSPQ